MKTNLLRLLALALGLFMLSGSLTGCISTSAEELPPQEAESTEADTGSTDNEGSENSTTIQLDRSKIIISVWDYQKAISQTEEGAQSLKEFGADLVVHPSPTAAYDMLSKYGIAAFGNKVNIPKSTLARLLSDILQHYRNGAYDDIAGGYSDEECFVGDYMYDEIPPKDTAFLTFRHLVQMYQEQMPGQLCYIILNPAYNVDGEMLDFDSYEEYVEMFCRTIPVDYISFDIYPFWRQEQSYDPVTKLLPTYLYTYDTIASAARKYNRDMWVILQAGSNLTDDYALMTDAQLRNQVFTALAYGANQICYANYTPSWWKKNTSLWQSTNANVGHKTFLWDIAKQINEEVHALSDTFMKYESMGVYTFGSSTESALNIQLREQNERSEKRGYSASSIDGFTDITTEQAILVGGFLEKEGNGCAAMFVNQTDPFSADASATFSFRITEEGKTVTAHHHGISEILTATNGVYQFTLASGEGVFLTID